MIHPVIVSDLLVTTGEFQNFFKNIIYCDFGRSVLFIMNVMKKCKVPPETCTVQKTEEKSNHFRDLGNKQFANGQYSKALQYYNASLLAAPAECRSLKLAYGNRSAVFYEMKRFKACLADIETCLSLGYPSEFMPKLIKRKNGCTFLQRRETTKEARSLCSNFLRITKINKSIPCATVSVTIRKDDSKQSVVAVEKINAGVVIAIETAFTAVMKKSDSLICCYYCQRFTENLIPCDSCCFALFCNEECKEKCGQEYHNTECQIMNVLTLMPEVFKLSLKTVLKAKHSYSGWVKLIEMVDNVFLKNNDVEFCDSSPYSHLCSPPKFETITKHGSIFNYAVGVANTINALAKIPSFMPEKAEEKELVTHFLAQQLMYHCISSTVTRLSNTDELEKASGESRGFFPFVGKFGHSCNPNVTIVGLNNKIALIALTEIRQGTELVISYGNHFHNANRKRRRRELLQRYAFLCKCACCLNNWTQSEDTYLDKLTEHQRDFMRRINLEEITEEIRSHTGALQHYDTIRTGVTVFYELPESMYYYIFRKALVECLWTFKRAHNDEYTEGCVDIIHEYESKIIT